MYINLCTAFFMPKNLVLLIGLSSTNKDIIQPYHFMTSQPHFNSFGLVMSTDDK